MSAMSLVRVSVRQFVVRSVGAALILAAGIALAVVHLGVFAVALGVIAFATFATLDGLVDRLMALTAIVAGAFVLLALAGPEAEIAVTPAVLAVTVTLPGAVALALGRDVRRPSRSSLQHDAIILLAALGSAACFGYGYLAGNQAERLRSMIRGGTDYLAHYDLLQNVWVHHGFPFVHTSGAFVERRDDLTATPTGFHAIWSLLGTLVTGHSTPPQPTRLLDLLAASYVVQAVMLTMVSVWAVSRVLRTTPIVTSAAVPALLFVGAATVVGPIAGLTVEGFATFVLGLSLVIVAVTFAVTTRVTRWRGAAGVLWCSAVAGAFTYTLLIPALAGAWAMLLWRSRNEWRRGPFGVALAVVASVTLTAAMATSAITVLPNGSAIIATGGIDPIPRGLLLGVTTAAAVALFLGRTALPQAVRSLSVVATATAVVCAAFWAEQVVTVGAVRYYAEKTAYVWLALGLIAVAAQAATLLQHHLSSMTQHRRVVVAGILSVAALWSFGYIGPSLRGVAPLPGTQPVAFRWFLESGIPPAQRESQRRLAADVLSASRLPGPSLRLLWESTGNTRHSRWMAILGGHWSTYDDHMMTTVIAGGSCSVVALSNWLASHPRDVVLVAAHGAPCAEKAAQMARGRFHAQVVVRFL